MMLIYNQSYKTLNSEHQYHKLKYHYKIGLILVDITKKHFIIECSENIIFNKFKKTKIE